GSACVDSCSPSVGYGSRSKGLLNLVPDQDVDSLLDCPCIRLRGVLLSHRLGRVREGEPAEGQLVVRLPSNEHRAFGGVLDCRPVGLEVFDLASQDGLFHAILIDGHTSTPFKELSLRSPVLDQELPRALVTELDHHVQLDPGVYSPIRFRSLSRTSILYPISVGLVSRLERQPHPRSGRSRNDADSARGSSFGNSPELWIGVQVGPVVLALVVPERLESGTGIDNESASAGYGVPTAARGSHTE